MVDHERIVVLAEQRHGTSAVVHEAIDTIVLRHVVGQAMCVSELVSDPPAHDDWASITNDPCFVDDRSADVRIVCTLEVCQADRGRRLAWILVESDYCDVLQRVGNFGGVGVDCIRGPSIGCTPYIAEVAGRAAGPFVPYAGKWII